MEAKIGSRDGGSSFHLERAVAGASFGMLILGTDRRIALANGRARRLVLNEAAGDPVGKLLSTVVQPELRSALEGIVGAVLRERRMVEADRLRAAEGRTVDVVGYAAEDESGMSQVVIVANDVTERLALENQLVQSSKLATIGELAAGVAHEINNPTAFVHSNLRTVQKYWSRVAAFLAEVDTFISTAGDDPRLAALRQRREALKIDGLAEDLPAALTESLEGTTRIQKIVQDLKSFARADDEEWRLVSLPEVIERALRLVQNEVKYVAQVVRELEPVPAVRANASQLNQVAVNLLMNAAQAIDGKGCITVRTLATAAEVGFEVEDDGCGIAQSNLSRIFDPFFTTKPPGRGTGLGLSVSLGIVERHVGRIEVETEEGRGSIFRVWLPREPELRGPASNDGGPR